MFVDVFAELTPGNNQHFWLSCSKSLSDNPHLLCSVYLRYWPTEPELQILHIHTEMRMYEFMIQWRVYQTAHLATFQNYLIIRI